MDIGSVRPVMTGITAPVPRAPAQGDQSTTTDLPARATVTEAGRAESSSVGSSTSQSAKAANASEHRNASLDQRIEIDESTRTIIFQKIDKDTGDVISQVPEESLLRMHAAMQAKAQSQPATSAMASSQLDESV